jgi:hypothetical protein
LPAPRLPSIRSPEVLARAKRLRNFKTRQRIKRGAGAAALAGGNFLYDFLLGFFDIDFDKNQKSKLGLLGEVLGAGVAGGDGQDNLPLPTMEKPKRVTKVNNPTFATLSNQLDTLVKTANKIGVYTKDQQDALLNQIKQARKVAKEQQLEQKTAAIPEMPKSNEGNITPLDSSIDGLIDKIDQLSDTIDDKKNGGGSSLLDGIVKGLGLAGLFGGAKSLIKGRGAAKLVKAAHSPTGYAYAAGSVVAGRKVGGQFAKAPLLARAGTAIKAAARTGAAKVAGSALVSSAASSRIAGLLSAGVKGIGKQAGKSAISGAVRRIAGPLITKTLGSTALKSIPIVGAGIGAMFAIGRLLKGDVLGAGLDLTSGLGGPLTAIPAFAASVARDTYAGVYGVQPEQDPNFNKNFPELKTEVENMIKEALGQSVHVQALPTDQQIGEMETPPAAPQRVSQAPATPSAPPSTTATPPGAGPSTTAAPVVNSTTVDKAATVQPVVNAQPAAAMESASAQTGMALNPEAMQSPLSSTGAELNRQELDMSRYEQFGYSPQQGMFVPQTGQTTRGSAQGRGTIPDPVYEGPFLEELKKTLFFGYAG